MALPNSLNASSPTGSDDPGQTDLYIREIKQAVIDIFGLPDNTNISAAALEIIAAGLKNVRLQTVSGIGASNLVGRLTRDGDTLYWHDGNKPLVLYRHNTDPLNVPTGYLYGLTLSNNSSDATNDIDIAAGECSSMVGGFSFDAGASRRYITLASSMTKRLDAVWAAGTGNGGRHSTEAIANGTWHVYALYLQDSGDTYDVIFSQSLTPTFTGVGTHYFARRLGSFLRVSGEIMPFRQFGNWFYLKTPYLELDLNNPGTLSTQNFARMPRVPDAWARMSFHADTISASETVSIIMKSTNIGPYGTPGVAGTQLAHGTANQIRVGQNWIEMPNINLSGDYYLQLSTSSTDTYVRAALTAWHDWRGTYSAET